VLDRNIKRIIFTTLKKFDGKQKRHLSASEIKQVHFFFKKNFVFTFQQRQRQKDRWSRWSFRDPLRNR